MPLTMRPSGLATTGYYKDHADYLIFCGKAWAKLEEVA
jgi:hypothetical protein